MDIDDGGRVDFRGAHHHRVPDRAKALHRRHLDVRLQIARWRTTRHNSKEGIASMTLRLENRVALVIGAARGIGEAIAARFVEEGAKVVIADREVEAGEATAERLGGQFTQIDVSSFTDTRKAVGIAVAAYGTLDILVQNAGIYPWTLIENTSPEEWDAVLGVNLKGTFLAARAALPVMREKGYGRMIFTSSITGPRVTSPGHGHYSASKAGINGFIKSAALEFAGYGITVNGLEPGNILTEGVKQHRSEAFIRTMQEAIPLGRLGTPRDIANAALFLASDDAAYITGTTVVVDGGQTLPEGKDFRIKPDA
jgi:3-oxoacyl-[acyl-carrier protein] reductase